MTQGGYWIATAIAVVLAVVAGIGDWLRVHRRRSIDDIGWVPWRGIQAASFFAALAFAILAMKSG